MEIMKKTRHMKEKAIKLKDLYIKLTKIGGTDGDKLEYIDAYDFLSKALNEIGELSASSGIAAKLLLRQTTKQMIYFSDSRYKDLYEKCRTDLLAQ